MNALAPSVTSTPHVRAAQFLHWLFVRDGRALSCSVWTRTDLTCAVHIVPLWESDAEVIETFSRPKDALRRHAEIASNLREAGWLLAEHTRPGAAG
jgi:hypothetical protein